MSGRVEVNMELMASIRYCRIEPSSAELILDFIGGISAVTCHLHRRGRGDLQFNDDAVGPRGVGGEVY